MKILKKEIVEITPQMASDLLSRNHYNQRTKRKLHSSLVIHYKNLMKQGKWRTEECSYIVIDPEGNLINGQHRLTAIVELQQSVSSWVVTKAQ